MNLKHRVGSASMLALYLWLLMLLMHGCQYYLSVSSSFGQSSPWRTVFYVGAIYGFWGMSIPLLGQLARCYPLVPIQWSKPVRIHLLISLVVTFPFIPLLHGIASGSLESTQFLMGVFIFRSRGELSMGGVPDFEAHVFRFPYIFHVFAYWAIVATFQAFSFYRNRGEMATSHSILAESAQNVTPQTLPGREPEQETPDYAKRLAIKESGRIVLIDLNDVDWIEAAGDYIKVNTKGKMYLGHERMKSVEKKLDPGQFVRIHRSVIVSLASIKELHPYTNREYDVVLHTGKRLKVSRGYSAKLREILGEIL